MRWCVEEINSMLDGSLIMEYVKVTFNYLVIKLSVHSWVNCSSDLCVSLACFFSVPILVVLVM